MKRSFIKKLKKKVKINLLELNNKMKILEIKNKKKIMMMNTMREIWTCKRMQFKDSNQSRMNLKKDRILFSKRTSS